MFYCENCQKLMNIKKSVAEHQNEVGFFFCESCGTAKKLDNSTLVYQSIKNTNKKQIEPEFSSLDIYQRKMLKKCSNASCTSKKGTEVVICKDGNFNVNYICITCKQVN